MRHRLQCASADRRLEGLVRAFAQRDVESRPEPKSQLLPARLEEVLEFQFGANYQLSGGSGGLVTPPRSAAIGIYTQNDCVAHFSDSVTSFAIFFQPNGLCRLFGIPATVLTGRAFDAPSLLGSEVARLHERMGNAATFGQRKQLAEEFLLQRSSFGKWRPDPVDLAASSIAGLCGRVRLTEVAEGAGLGRRQFERRFRENTGLSPKMYARLARFQTAVDIKLRSPRRTWLEIAHALSYHDQMHMIRDFYRFGGRPPQQVLASIGDARPESLRERRSSPAEDLILVIDPEPEPILEHTTAAGA